MRNVDLTTISTLFESKQNIVAAWTFGSAKNGEVRSGSDLDIGVLFANKPAFEDLLDLSGDLQQALNLEDVDLVVLNDASPILRFEAVSGCLIFDRDSSHRAAFVSLTSREYEDAMFYAKRSLRWRQEALATNAAAL